MNKRLISTVFLVIGITVGMDAYARSTTAQQDAKRETPIAEWTIACYIQADNNLAPFAEYNISDMEKVESSDQVNMLVQWDQPENLKTWRYKIEKGKRVEAGSLDTEMGINPENELVEMMKWAAEKYPAKHYMMILWNHGSGVEDLSKKNISCPVTSWIKPLSGSTLLLDADQRGILYDDSEGTMLTNQGLQRACRRIKNYLGQNIDIVGCDACLMAMIEVAHNMKNNVDYFVASQELEPGKGWPYSEFLKPLVSQPTLTPEELSNTIVAAYESFYKDDTSCTQSAFKMNNLDLICYTLDDVIDHCIQHHNNDPLGSLIMHLRARFTATEFDNKDFIDLYSFYEGLKDAIFKSSMEQESSEALYNESITLQEAVERAQVALLNGITSSFAGAQHNIAKGMSIYYPKGPFIDKKYKETSFALQTKWVSFLQMLQKV